MDPISGLAAGYLLLIAGPVAILLALCLLLLVLFTPIWLAIEGARLAQRLITDLRRKA